MKMYYIFAVILLLTQLTSSYAYNSYLIDGGYSIQSPHIVPYSNVRVRRDTATGAAAPTAPSPAPPTPAPPTPAPSTSATTASPAANATTNATDASHLKTDTNTTTAIPATVTQTPLLDKKVPLLGENGTGILQNITTPTKQPKVSDPIFPDDNITDMYKLIKAEQNITNLQNDTHTFYNSTFIGNVSYFDEYWANITKRKADAHAVLSNSHRRATTLKLSFPFPFYGHPVRNVTVATGGFVYMGEHVHNWLAATQYVAPLMANFDTTMTNDSAVKMVDDGEKFTAFWENVTLQEDKEKKFTFAVTLYKNGDIVFAYKDIPKTVQDIDEADHPVKVGISDAYLADRMQFLIRRKTIYEYHRVSFKNHAIASKTILRLTALPTCLQYDSCDACLAHDTGFNCMWCEAIRKCSSGTDRNKQDWLLRNCDKTPVTSAPQCPARPRDSPDTAYVTDTQSPHETVINQKPAEAPPSPAPAPTAALGARDAAPAAAGSRAGGAVAAAVSVAVVCAAAAWALYAFKNPHTRSGQLLIKYRPSQWTWRRGEARYTAATIHM